jgi:succinoglycan biosynthesis protein ExoM
LSLEQQNLPPEVSIETLVVDNDPDESGNHICEKFAKSTKLCLKYFRQPLKNISLTRNVAVKHATGTYLLFIDDDEVASSEWVMRMLQTIEFYDVDGVVGAVWPDFHPETPNWMKKCYVFHRFRPQTGAACTTMSTSNCIVKASLLKNMPGPFDSRYGLTGGEDTQLFRQLYRAGAKFVSSRESWAKEYIPPERTTVPWLLKRTLRSGNSFMRQKLESAGKRSLPVGFTVLVKTVTCLIAFGILAIVMLPRPHRCLHCLLKGSSNVGQLLAIFGIKIQEY